MARYEGFYPGEVFVKLDLPTAPIIIERLLWAGDHALLVGKEKAGKSLLALQLLCHLTAGEPVFGALNVPQPRTVAYCQAEGKLSDTQEHLTKMRKALDCEPSRFSISYFPALALDTEVGLRRLITSLESWQRPEVLLLDPLYAFMSGDLISNQDARRMVAHLRILREHFQTTLLLIHHAHRPMRDARTKAIIDEGDDSLFGSFVWKAYPDEVYLFEKTSPKVANKARRLSCDTQRMAQSIDLLNLELMDDPGLYYRLQEEKPGAHLRIMECFAHQNGGLTVAAICEMTQYARCTVWNVITHAAARGHIQVLNPTQKPRLFTLSSPAPIQK